MTAPSTDAAALAEELREYTPMKYAGDCKCGRCQLVPRDLVETIYHTLNSSALRQAAAPAVGREEARVIASIAWQAGLENWSLDRTIKHIEAFSLLAPETGATKSDGGARRFNDPVETIIADALDAAGIGYTHESANKAQRLDFQIANGPAIECKQFATPRTSAQIADVANVIVVQGIEAARWFANALTKSAPAMETSHNSGEREPSVMPAYHGADTSIKPDGGKILAGLNEAVRHARGEDTGARVTVRHVSPSDPTPAPNDELKAQVRDPKDCLSAFTVLKEAFPSLATPAPGSAEPVAWLARWGSGRPFGARLQKNHVYCEPLFLHPPTSEVALREALTDARDWHEQQDKALSKSGRGDADYHWRRDQHQQQRDIIDAALTGEGK